MAVTINYLRWVTIAILYLIANPCLSDSSIENPQKTLLRVRHEISFLQKEISQQEKARQATQHSIEISEKAFQKTRALVNALMTKHTTSQQKLSSLYQNLHTIQKQIDQISTAIASILQKQYVHYRQFFTTQLMSAQETARQTRIQSYYQYIAKAQQKLILQLQAQQVQLANLSGKVKSELHHLDEAVKSKKVETNKLKAKKIRYHLQEKKLIKNIQHKKKHLAQSLASEKQLSALVAKLQQQINKKNKVLSLQKTSTQSSKQIKAVANASVSGKKFLSLKRKIKLPIAGSITGKFGGARSAEGGTWKGIFISTRTQQSVHAVADGTIVYAGRLSGFGQLSIIDHGERYLTIYAGLSSVSLSKGQKIKAGDVLGQSGTLDSGETGLYFEIRHGYQPIDPLNWITLS